MTDGIMESYRILVYHGILFYLRNLRKQNRQDETGVGVLEMLLYQVYHIIQIPYGNTR